MTALFYYLGRGAQMLGMSLLLVDVIDAGPMGPNPRLFALGVGVFLGGWGLLKAGRK
ncbi:MAG TPA: hypothetical protein VF456_05460 [Vicinamibacterales bacterium]|jgi:hypothetical protein